MQLLKELHAMGNTLVLITHDQEIAAQAPSRVQLFDGKVISDSAGLGSESGSSNGEEGDR